MKKSDRQQTQPDLFEALETPSNTNTAAEFFDAKNPAHLLVLHALLEHPRRIKEIEKIANSHNGHNLIADLRRRGLEIPCYRIKAAYRKGYAGRPGVYHLTHDDRRKLAACWFPKRKGGAA